MEVKEYIRILKVGLLQELQQTGFHVRIKAGKIRGDSAPKDIRITETGVVPFAEEV
jgi:hypothetical protein